jgi:hypothetical protein
MQKISFVLVFNLDQLHPTTMGGAAPGAQQYRSFIWIRGSMAPAPAFIRGCTAMEWSWSTWAWFPIRNHRVRRLVGAPTLRSKFVTEVIGALYCDTKPRNLSSANARWQRQEQQPEVLKR